MLRTLLGHCIRTGGIVLFLSAQAGAGLLGSYHDFTGSGEPNITSRGACSACHVPHFAGDTDLWTRDLFQERAYFDQDADPDYIPSSTVKCYDCHIDAEAADPAPDNDPKSWPPGEEPQDIAFTDGPPESGGTQTGYYELADGTIPSLANPAPTDGSPTGGHFWKSEPTGSPDYRQGDKLPCSLCHDPHDALTGGNEAFFLTETTDGTGASISLGNSRRASGNTREGTGTGRDMCAACHSYSDSGGTGVPADPVNMWNVTLPKPPVTIPQHVAANITPCTDCHSHNSISVSCSGCHANPPLEGSAAAGGFFDPASRPLAESYSGGAGAHRRHLDALGLSIFACEICHGPAPGNATWHNFGNGTVLQGNVDIMGKSSFWDPAGSLSTGYAGTGSPEAIPPGYDFTAKGGSDGPAGGRCYGLACHGDPPDIAGALNWTDDMVDDATGAPLELNICRWCHDATNATIDGGAVYGPNVMGDSSSFGAEVNGHGLTPGRSYDRDTVGDGLGQSGAGKDCTVCHDARYQANPTPPPDSAPVKTHFDGSFNSAEKRLRDTINGLGVAGAGDVCLACHQNAGPDAGSQVSTHGNSEAGGYARIEPDAFTRQCRQCHDPHGLTWNGTGRNLSMVGRWLDNTPGGNRSGTPDPGEEAVVDTDNSLDFSAADRPVVFTATSGDGSWDDGFDNGRHDSICVVCHDNLVNNHNEFGSPELQGAGHNPVGTDCSPCHSHDYDSSVTTADGFMPSGCTGCHGNSANNTVWPDSAGTVKTAYPDRLGRHTVHVEQVMNRLNATATAAGGWSDLPRTLLTLTEADQRRICEYCHNDPAGAGGGGHYPQGYSKDDAPADVGDFNPLWDTANPPSSVDAGAIYTPATYDMSDIYTGGSTCAAVGCHNNKGTAPLTFGWYDTAAGDCTLCHTAGAAGANPNSGLHSLDDPANGTVSHDESFGGAFTCTDCHQNPPADAHISGVPDTPATAAFAWNSSSMALSLNVLADDTDNTCTATCHSDGGDWTRLWSTAADADHTVTTPGQDYCAICHGEPGGFRAGVEHVPDPPHSCDTCHFITSSPQHRDGNIEINDNLDPGCSDPTSLQIGTAPPGVFCSGCHANDADHTSPRADGRYWAHDIRTSAGVCIQGGHPSAACLNCHNTAQGSIRLIASVDFTQGDFSVASHHIDHTLAASQVQKERGCIACHYESEAGGNDGLAGLKHYSAAGAITDAESGKTYDVLSYDPSAPDLAVVTQFCQGCHSAYMDVAPFALASAGDTTLTTFKAWDGSDVASRYGNTGTTSYGKYSSSTYNVTPADQVTKAFSPHGNAAANQQGTAFTGAWTDTTGTVSIECLHCHNAHGSAITATWWKGPAAVTGGILLDEVSLGTGPYQPSGGTFPDAADLCWDCHYGDDDGPRTYADFGATNPVASYFEFSSPTVAERWGSSASWYSSFDYKRNLSFRSDHIGGKSASMSSTPTHDTTVMACGGCHDPHGVSSNQAAANYMVPALKGTWVTSPYKEDRPPRTDYSVGADDLTQSAAAGSPFDPFAGKPGPRANPWFGANSAAGWPPNYNVPEVTGGGYGTWKYVFGSGYTQSAGSYGWNGFFIDDNTFGTTDGFWGDVNIQISSVATENDVHGNVSDTYGEMGGLCGACHTATSIKDTSSATLGGTATFPHHTVSDHTAFGTIGTNLFNRGLRAAKPWYGSPPTMHGMDHAPGGWNGTWGQYGPDGPMGQVDVDGDQNDDFGVTDSTVSTKTEDTHRYAWGPDPTVQGEGGTDGVEPTFHNFTCSKCHTPHLSALPRLMRTNCLDNDSGWSASSSSPGPLFPGGYYTTYVGAEYRNVACHGTGVMGSGSHIPGVSDDGGWNDVTPW